MQEPEQPMIQLFHYDYGEHLKFVLHTLKSRGIERAQETVMTLQDANRGNWPKQKIAAALSFYMDKNLATELANEEFMYSIIFESLMSEIRFSENTGIASVKEWTVSPDEKTCAACKAMAGTIAPLDGVYPVNGSILLPQGIRPAIVLDLHATFLHAGCRCFHQTRVFDPATGEIQ